MNDKQSLILVAGGGGFIGGHLVADLKAKGHTRIRSVDIKPFDDWYQVHPEAENLQLDLREPGACEEAMKDVAIVYNLACDMGGMGFIENNKALCMISVLINTHLLLAAKDAGVELGAVDDVVLVGGSTRVPLVRARLEALVGKPPHAHVDPDLAVALGAAIQADVLAGNDKSLLLLDVIPLSLGIETLGGAVQKLILRNSTIPTSVSEEFSTGVDDQTAVDLAIYQGERELAKDCRLLGQFKLSGIPPLPAGLPRVQVTFLVDADGVLRVTARTTLADLCSHAVKLYLVCEEPEARQVPSLLDGFDTISATQTALDPVKL